MGKHSVEIVTIESILTRMASDAASPVPRRWITAISLYFPPTKIGQQKLEESSNSPT
jgi:hypothetical protein